MRIEKAAPEGRHVYRNAKQLTTAQIILYLYLLQRFGYPSNDLSSYLRQFSLNNSLNRAKLFLAEVRKQCFYA